MSQMRTFEGARWMIEFYHQWDSFIPRVNWRDFTFICIEGEWNHSWPLVEIRVVLLGLGIRVVRQLDAGDNGRALPEPASSPTENPNVASGNPQQ